MSEDLRPISAPNIKPAPQRATFRQRLKSVFSTNLLSSDPRMRWIALVFLGLYVVICGKLIYLGLKPEPTDILIRACA